MALPDSFIQHLRTEGYHSRSDKHSKALSEAIIRDLMQRCPKMAADATAGRVVFEHNFDLTYGHATWNTDLAIGPPPPGAIPVGAPTVEGMVRARPSSIRVAVEAKAVMTEHRKAIKNRKRDLEAHHAHVHDYDPQAIAAGVVIVNASETFQSPLLSRLTTHKRIEALMTHCMGEINSITMSRGGHAVGLDSKCAVIVITDNVTHAAAGYWTKPPAPPVGSPIHWDSFISRICDLYARRFP